jgi:small GTP-binding protein
MDIIIKRTLSLLLLIVLTNSCNCNSSEKRHTQSKDHISNPSLIHNEVVVFLGNPGVGKSTLCNSIFGKTIFNSGISAGTGMTEYKQEYTYDNKLYVDTPGLRDIEKSEQAALEIERALKKNSNYKIVFVATLDEGRIRADDLVTINMICSAIKTNFEYGLIFNKISKKTVKKIKQTGSVEQALYAYLKPLKKKPFLTIILTRDQIIEGEDNMYFQKGGKNIKKLLAFLNSLKAYKIEEKDVKKIDVTDYEEEIKEVNKAIDELKKRLEK